MDVNLRLGLTFDDVLLEPQATAVSRSEVCLETNLTKKIRIKIPILAAAMDTLSEDSMAVALGRLGGVAVLHRNCSIEKQVGMVKKVKRVGLIAAAAVGPGDLKRAQALDKVKIDVIVIDTAHAHNFRAIKSAKEIKKKIKAQLIVGNIATAEAAKDVCRFADAVKVGVGPGAICTTRVVTGVGVPQLTAVLEVSKIASKKKIPVIADGGMKYSGDVVKALAAGASAVMLGSMLAGTRETPGKIIRINGEVYKAFRGMGSLGAMQSGKSSDRYFQHPLSISPLLRGRKSGGYVPEGVEGVIKYKGPLKDTIEQIIGGVRSGMGYLGAKDIPAMWKQARFIRITPAGLQESHPHSVIITKRAPNY